MTPADLLQLEIHRQMSPEQRLRLALEISDDAHALALAGIRFRHPAWTESQVREERIRMLLLPDPRPVDRG